VVVGVATGVVDVVVAVDAAAERCVSKADAATKPARPSSTHAIEIVR